MAGYKIKDLEQLTGIKAHTIRMWEKRYGILHPERTETQIRTYNDRELMLLLNVALLNKNGIKISHIAEMDSGQITQKVLDFRGDNQLDTSHEKLVLALVGLDEALFRSTLSELIDNVGLEYAFIDHLIPFLERIGVMWMVGTINPAQEHFMSNLIRQKIISETDKLPVPEAKNTALLFLPEHEWHEISLLFYHFVLRKAGKSTFYLGQSLPYNALLECIDRIKPCCLVTSWLTSVDGKFIQRYFEDLHTDTHGIPIFAGGYQVETHLSVLTKIEHIGSLESIRKIAAVMK